MPTGVFLKVPAEKQNLCAGERPIALLEGGHVRCGPGTPTGVPVIDLNPQCYKPHPTLNPNPNRSPT